MQPSQSPRGAITQHNFILGMDCFGACCDIPWCRMFLMLFNGSHMQCWESSHYLCFSLLEQSQNIDRECADAQHCV